MGGDEERGGSSSPFHVCRSSESLLGQASAYSHKLPCEQCLSSLSSPSALTTQYEENIPTHIPVLETVWCSLMEYVTHSQLEKLRVRASLSPEEAGALKSV